MLPTLRHQLWILLSAGVICFTCLGTAGLWDEDETWYASCAREMMQRGDWVVPMFNGHVFPEKPPLMFWTMIAGFETFGQNELGARFFSAVFAVATALLTYHLGRRLFNDRVAFWGAIATTSSIIFTVSARAATVDAALTFLTTAAVWCFVVIRGEGRGERGEKSPVSVQERGNKIKQFILFVGFYVCLGLAVLAKGPIGYLLPMTALGLFLMIKNYRPVPNVVQKTVEKPGLSAFLTRLDIFGVLKRILASFFVSLWQLRPLTGIAVTMAVAMPWYYLVAQRTSGEWLMTFIVDFCYRPFTQPILSHDGPFWYYLPAVLIGFFPWSVFLGPTCVDLYRRFRAHHPWSDSLVLLCCLFGSWFIFWSICSTKLPHYLLPVYPALALLTACFLDGWIAGQSQVARGWMRAAWFSSMFVGLGMTIALPIVAYLMFPGAEWIGAIGPILLFGGYLGWHFTAKENRLRAVQCYGFASIAFLTAAFGLASIGIARHQNAQPMMAAIHGDCPADASICEYRFHRKSSVYYAGHSISTCDKPEKLQEFLDSSQRPYIITLDEYQAEIEKNHPGEFQELTRVHRFGTVARTIELFRVKPSELVVLKYVGKSTSAQVAEKPGSGKAQ